MAKVESSKVIFQKAMYLSDKGEGFTLTKVNNSLKLESDWFGDSSSSPNRKLPPEELGFIKRVRNHVIRERIYEQFIDHLYFPIDIRYVDVCKHIPESKFENVIEIDINQAYWETAFKLGVISESLYKEGGKSSKKISKIGRLISLGSLARKEVKYTYQGRKLIKDKTTRSDLTENIWYSICKRVSDLMSEAKDIAGEDFILYWVDGIYLKYNSGKVAQKVKMFKEYDYEVEFKEKLIVTYSEDQVVVFDPSNPNPKTNSRRFFLSKKKRENHYYTDTELRETALKYSKYGAVDDITE